MGDVLFWPALALIACVAVNGLYLGRAVAETAPYD